AFYVPPLLGVPLTPNPSPPRGKGSPAPAVCILWCEAAEKDANPVAVLLGQLLGYCRQRFGSPFEEVVQQVDRAAGDDPVQRFLTFLQVLLANVPRLVLLLDNLESLLVGPGDATSDRPDERAFAEWKSGELRRLWQTLRQLAEGGDKLWLIGSSRYQNDDFLDALLPVTPLPGDALFRLTGWFPTLQQLAPATRAQLATRLAGHPRAAA